MGRVPWDVQVKVEWFLVEGREYLMGIQGDEIKKVDLFYQWSEDPFKRAERLLAGSLSKTRQKMFWNSVLFSRVGSVQQQLKEHFTETVTMTAASLAIMEPTLKNNTEFQNIFRLVFDRDGITKYGINCGSGTSTHTNPNPFYDFQHEHQQNCGHHDDTPLVP